MTDNADLTLLAGQAVALAEKSRDQNMPSCSETILAAARILATLSTFPIDRDSRTALWRATEQLAMGIVASALGDRGRRIDWLIEAVRRAQLWANEESEG